MGRATGKTGATAAVAALISALAIPLFAQTMVAQTTSVQTTSVQTRQSATDLATTDLARRVVLVSIPDRKLAVLDGDEVIATFPIAVGAAVSPSPTGEFEIVSRVSNPTYYHPGKVIPAGKDNPLGTRWLGLSQKGYGIHGTNAPRSVGHAASHGCIRLRNRDIERLFTLLRVGDTVVIRGERDEQTSEVFGSALDETADAADQAAAGAAGQ